MKKLLSFLVVALLILSLSTACWADAVRPTEAPAQLRQLAGGLRAQLRGNDAQTAHIASSAYTRTYTRPRTSPLSKAIAAGIVCGVAGLIKAIVGKGKKQDEAADSAPAEEVAADGSNRFVCKSCGKTRSGWYQTCPDCGASGTMVKLQQKSKE